MISCSEAALTEQVNNKQHRKLLYILLINIKDEIFRIGINYVFIATGERKTT